MHPGSRERLAAARIAALRPASDRALELVTGLLVAPLRARTDLVGVHGPRPGSGRTDGEFWESDGWFLKSRLSRTYAREAQALAELDALAERKARLGALVPAGALLALLELGPGTLQLWTIAPRLVTLRERLGDAAEARDWPRFTRALLGFAHGLGEAVSSSVDDGLALDASPANFAAQGARLRYIDDDVVPNRDAIGIEDAFLARFVEYPHAPAAAWEAYLRRFLDEVRRRVPCSRVPSFDLSRRLEVAAGFRRGSEAWAERARRLLEPGKESS